MEERYKFSLELRKEKIFDYFLNRRLKIDNYSEEIEASILVDDEYNNTYEINIETLSIPDEVKEDYKKVT
jgi:hypothetical protein